MVQLARHPDAYSGDGRVEEWCLLMFMFITASEPGATDENKKIALFTNLTGAALTWAKSQIDPETNTPIGTPSEFANHLIARFTPYADARKAEAELEHLVLKTTVSKYIKDFTAIVSRIPNMNDDDQRHRFTEGIKKKSIRLAVDRANPATFDEACRAALIEDLDFVTAATAATATTSAPRPPANSNAMDIDAFQTPHLNKLTDQERAYLRSINACFRCCQRGHQQHSCPMLSGQHKPFTQNKQQFPQRRGPQVNNMEWPQMPYGYPAPYPYVPNPYMYSAFGFPPGPATQQQQQQQQQQQSPQDFQPGQ